MSIIPKLKREDLAGDLVIEQDIPAQTFSLRKVLKRKDGIGGELICALDGLKASQLEEDGIDPTTPEGVAKLDAMLEERMALDLQEINHEGLFADVPMDEVVHDMRLEMGLETVL